MDRKPKLFIELTRNYDRVNPGYAGRFREAGCDVRFMYGQDYKNTDREKLASMLKDCDVFSVCLIPVTGEMMDLAPDLRLICTFGAGYDHIDLKAAAERGIPVVNGRGGAATAVAELVVSMMTALARNLPAYDREMRRGVWSSRMGVELFGKTAGILGVGAIGSELARILRNGFNMKILAHDIFENQELKERYGVSYVDTDTLFKKSDFISVHTPLLPTTKGMVNAQKIGLMKPTAFIINASRGGVLDETALYGALKAGKIAGAGLDVFETEPYTQNIFSEFDNVVTSAHSGANTPETVFRIAEILTESINDVLAGKPPRRNVVNGYMLKQAGRESK
ncbi:MAG: phosphoglycerate dehydrogenase [Bacillota bacterium]|nr:phosphoglycerate dehydrogenase [Bacillota bacterium]